MSALASLVATPIEPGRVHRAGFGWINVGGRHYEHDRILLPDGVSGPWWRPRRHWFDLVDAEALCAEFAPEIVVVGIGWMGMLQVDPAATDFLAGRGVDFEPLRIPEAVRRLQRLAVHGRRVVAPLHLTC